MTPEQFDRVLGACRLFVAMGGRIRTRTYGVEFGRDGRIRVEALPGERPCACALGAFALTAQPEPYPEGPRSVTFALTRELGINGSQLLAFVAGFDDRPHLTPGSSAVALSFAWTPSMTLANACGSSSRPKERSRDAGAI